MNEDGNDGLMVLDGSDDDEEDDHANTLERDSGLVHYENQQFLDMEETRVQQGNLIHCGLIKLFIGDWGYQLARTPFTGYHDNC